MNVAIYARVSTDMQVKYGHSLGAQVEDCTAKAKELGATIIKEYIDDGYSGAYLDRPALIAMREAIRSKLFQAVVCYDVDRLSRDLSHQLLITEEIEKSGASLVFVKSNYENTAEGKLFFAIKGAFAGYEREKFRERTSRGRLAVLKKGMVIEDSHVYGYDYDKNTRSYRVNQGEASIVRKIFDLYLNGFGGISAITVWLNEHMDEFPPPRGIGWSKSVIHEMLKREMYTGKYYSNRIYHEKVGIKKERRTERPRKEWIEMSCPAIITEEQHKEALQLLKTNRKRDYHKKRHPYILQSLAYCGVCGRRLSIRQSSGVSRYMCWINSDREKKQPSKCGARSMICEVVDEAFWEILEEICRSPKRLKAYIQKTEPPPLKDLTAKRNARLEKIKAERKATLAWFGQQLITHEEATAKLQELKKRENNLLQDNLADMRKAKLIDYEATCKAVVECKINAEARRSLVRQIIDRVVLTRTDNRNSRSNYALDIKIYFK
jgi:site-specific DNA recombinase